MPVAHRRGVPIWQSQYIVTVYRPVFVYLLWNRRLYRSTV